MRVQLIYMITVLVAGFLMSSCNKNGVITDPDEPETPETSHYRPASAESSMSCTKVYDYTPAPGQFINTTDISTASEASEWAFGMLRKNEAVSLGAFGGYIVVGFDHSIAASANGDYDFAIYGNSYTAVSGFNGGSNEPGVVYVMQDSNGNGEPDDTWYELKGSEWKSTGTAYGYSVTYYRPEGPKQAVKWTDSLGNEGEVDYVEMFHKQDYYYPAWIKEDKYTLTGTRLSPNNYFDEESGYWLLMPYSGGYADNMGEDNTSTDKIAQVNRFRISDAINPDGTTAKLSHIDFIKVQTGVNSKSGILGEISTEVRGFEDLSSAK